MRVQEAIDCLDSSAQSTGDQDALGVLRVYVASAEIVSQFLVSWLDCKDCYHEYWCPAHSDGLEKAADAAREMVP